MFKIGDKVEVVNDYETSGYSNKNISTGQIYTIRECFMNNIYGHYYNFVENQYSWAWGSQLKLINNNIKNMNIKEKFALALTSEPMKSFRKAGVTDGDDLLTEDGKAVFLSWLLNKKFADDFKKDVVDDMLKDLEEEK